MRDSISNVWIIGLIVSFILIFVSFLTLSLSYNKVLKVKNEVLTFIEKFEGLKDGDNGSIKLINNYLIYNNYNTMHHCDVGEYGVNNLASTNLETVTSKKDKYYYCVSKNKIMTDNNQERTKYEVTFFFKFNLPVIGELLTFEVPGLTIDITFPADNLNYRIQ